MGATIQMIRLADGATVSSAQANGDYKFANFAAVLGAPSFSMSRAEGKATLRVKLPSGEAVGSDIFLRGTTLVALSVAANIDVSRLVFNVGGLETGESLVFTDEPNGSLSSPFTTTADLYAYATANLASLLSGRSTAWAGNPAVEYVWNGPLNTDWQTYATRNAFGRAKQSAPRKLVGVGYFGPSTADNSVGVTDMLADLAPAFPGSGSTIYIPTPAGKMEACTGRGLYLSACAGISGETIQQSADRTKATKSAARKAAQDLANTKTEIVIYKSCAINTIQGYVIAPSDAEIDAQVATEVAIAKYFVAKGLCVIFEGPFGYSAAVAAGLLALRRDAVVRYLSRYKAALSSVKGVAYLDAIGLTCASDGSFLAGISTDGIHLNQSGGVPVFVAESKLIDSYVGDSIQQPRNLFDCEKAFFDAADTSTFTLSNSGGNTGSLVRGNLANYADITAAAGGASTFIFLSTPLLNVFTGSDKKFVIVFDYDIAENGTILSESANYTVQFRTLFRNGGDLIFDSTIAYKRGHFSVPVILPAAAVPTLVQCFVKITSANATPYRATFRPLLVALASEAT